MADKVLFVSHTSNFVKFNLPYMKWFKGQGYEVHYASSGEEPLPQGCCDKEYKIPFERSPYSKKNIKAFKELKRVMNEEKYDIVHCHTPVGGVLARLAARKLRKKGTKVIYTAHGFHFFNGARKRNWLLYFPVEKFLSRYTDCLVTINNEDYERVKRRRFKAKDIHQINGVGVDLKRFKRVPVQVKDELRKQNNLSQEDFVVLYIAEFNPEKDHAFLLNQMADLRKEMPNLKVLLAGTGKLVEETKALAKQLGLDDCINFLGYCRNIDELCAMSDILVSVSRREGLPISIIEGMASGLPVVCSQIRGHVDVIKNGQNGFLYAVDDAGAFKQGVMNLYSDLSLRSKISDNNLEDVKKFSLENALLNMEKIYSSYMKGGLK